MLANKMLGYVGNVGTGLSHELLAAERTAQNDIWAVGRLLHFRLMSPRSALEWCLLGEFLR